MAAFSESDLGRLDFRLLQVSFVSLYFQRRRAAGGMESS
jgi:hypothetical protein